MLRLPLALLAATMAALVVAATHTPHGDCDSKGWAALGIVEVTGGTADTTTYIDDRNYLLGNGVWWYVETNGLWTQKMPGVFANDIADHDLQRGSNCGGGAADECQVPYDGPRCIDDLNVIPDLVVL